MIDAGFKSNVMKNNHHPGKLVFTLFVSLLFFSTIGFSQNITSPDSLYKMDSVSTNSFSPDTTPVANKINRDTATSVNNGYYIVYPKEVIVRIYLTNKFAPFTISSNNKEDLNYKTNLKLGLGAGFTYKALTLNLAYGFNFLNPDKGKGKTKGLDLQLHLYPNKWAIDFTGAFLNGYYLDPKDYNGLNLTDYYKRPDLHRNILALSVYRIANQGKFSYKASFNQKDWQIRSAGSFLYGGETHYGIVKGDSALVPAASGTNYVQAGIDQIRFFGIGPGIGYAYTLVMGRHFFITASAIVSLNIEVSDEERGLNKNEVTKILPGGNYKAAIGYNSSTWSLTAGLLGNAVYAASAASKKEYFLPTGNVNLVLARKFGTKRK
jgi:hypothetical protein